ncbi:hypothetical protein TNCV_2242751 [Trichonephila clavipes]|nr:hypothetical protein TNCV_2242751 [Trichonephila clavipes]
MDFGFGNEDFKIARSVVHLCDPMPLQQFLDDPVSILTHIAIPFSTRANLVQSINQGHAALGYGLVPLAVSSGV